VSLKTLQCHGLARRKQLPNTPAGHTKLLELLPTEGHVVMESSGGYEKALWLTLLRDQRRVSRLNARRVHALADTKGQ
jgi:hypothetical protein